MALLLLLNCAAVGVNPFLSIDCSYQKDITRIRHMNVAME